MAVFRLSGIGTGRGGLYIKTDDDVDVDVDVKALRAFAATWDPAAGEEKAAAEVAERGEERRTRGQNNSSNAHKHLVLRKPQNVLLR
jgi:hypothetical protein